MYITKLKIEQQGSDSGTFTGFFTLGLSNRKEFRITFIVTNVESGVGGRLCFYQASRTFKSVNVVSMVQARVSNIFIGLLQETLAATNVDDSELDFVHVLKLRAEVEDQLWQVINDAALVRRLEILQQTKRKSL